MGRHLIKSEFLCICVGPWKERQRTVDWEVLIESSEMGELPAHYFFLPLLRQAVYGHGGEGEGKTRTTPQKVQRKYHILAWLIEHTYRNHLASPQLSAITGPKNIILWTAVIWKFPELAVWLDPSYSERKGPWHLMCSCCCCQACSPNVYDLH